MIVGSVTFGWRQPTYRCKKKLISLEKLAGWFVAFNQNIVPAVGTGVASDESNVHLDGGNDCAADGQVTLSVNCGASFMRENRAGVDKGLRARSSRV